MGHLARIQTLPYFAFTKIWIQAVLTVFKWTPHTYMCKGWVLWLCNTFWTQSKECLLAIMFTLYVLKNCKSSMYVYHFVTTIVMIWFNVQSTNLLVAHCRALSREGVLIRDEVPNVFLLNIVTHVNVIQYWFKYINVCLKEIGTSSLISTPLDTLPQELQ